MLEWTSAGRRREEDGNTAMKKFLSTAITAAAFGLVLVTGAHAATAQQNLAGRCSSEAKGKKGDDYKSAVSSCMSDGKKRQQEKMKMCNTDATGKKGDARKAFMSDCLSK
jgi:hypothetical protein